MQIVKNKAQRVICFPAMKGAPKGVNLLPGVNELDSEIVEIYGKMIEEHSALEVPQMEADDDLADSLLGQYSAKDAIDIVKETYDHDVLVRYRSDEQSDKKRATVLKTIEAQIKENEAARESE